MKYTAVLATVVAVVSAQACDPNSIPSCARNLIEANVKAVTGCEPTDYKCTCNPANQAKLTAAITTQVIAACGADKVGDVLSATEKFCTAVAAGACGSGSGSGSSSSSAAQSSTTTARSSSSSSSAANPTTTTTSATSSAPKPSATVPSPSGNGTTPRPTGGPVPAGAGMLTAAGSGLIVAIVGAFALL